MQVQTTYANGQGAAAKGYARSPEQSADSGAFESAMSALMALACNRYESFKQAQSASSSRHKGSKDHTEVLDIILNRTRPDGTDKAKIHDHKNELARQSADAAVAGEQANDAKPSGGSGGTSGQPAADTGIVTESVVTESVGLSAAVPSAGEQSSGSVPAENQSAVPQTGTVDRRMDTLLEQLIVSGNTGGTNPQAAAQANGVNNSAAAAGQPAGEANQAANNALMAEMAAKDAPEEMKPLVAGNLPNADNKGAAALPENAHHKPAADSGVKVIVAEQQQQPQPQQQQQQQQNANYKPAAPVSAEVSTASANNPVMAEKIEPPNVLPVSGTAQQGAQLAAQPASEPVSLFGLRDRVLQEIRHVYQNMGNGDRQTQVHLKLQPEHLGQLTVRLFFQKGGEITAHFYAASNNVKEVLESSMQQLRTALGQQDLKLNETQVFVSSGGYQQQDNPGFNTEGHSQGLTALYADDDDYSGEEVAAEKPQGATEADGSASQVNYLV